MPMENGGYVNEELSPENVEKRAAVPGEAAVEYQRVPSYDKPCAGGNHFTLGYRNDARHVVYICPNAECALFTRSLEAPAENKPKVKWWNKLKDGTGNAIGEWFGSR